MTASISRPYNTARRARDASTNQLSMVSDACPDSYPRLGIPLTHRQRLENAGVTPDEITSILTYTSGQHVESAWVSADEYTPWDEYTGGAA